MDASINEVLSFLFLPFLTCLVLAGIHCYLGFHVLTRGVIFVDLSLAQVAAFGSTLAILLGFQRGDIESYFITLFSTLLAAWVFAIGRKWEKRIPQEALIGIIYALGSAAVILATEKIAHGTEHVKNLLVGQVLWVTWREFFTMTTIYCIVGVIHYVFKEQFFKASAGKMNSRQGLWDFLFYALFGVVITSSVKIAGVLQVFAYLIVPSVVANIFFKGIRPRLIFGWSLGFLVSLVGMIGSYAWDLPSGASIVVCFTLIPVVLIFLMPLFNLER